MMDRMSLRVIGAGRLLFFEKDKVYVVVSGSILMQCHQEQSDLARSYAKFGDGDILNFL